MNKNITKQQHHDQSLDPSCLVLVLGGVVGSWYPVPSFVVVPFNDTVFYTTDAPFPGLYGRNRGGKTIDGLVVQDKRREGKHGNHHCQQSPDSR